MSDDSTETGGDGTPRSEHRRISRRLFVAGAGAAAATLIIDTKGVVRAAPRDGDAPITPRSSGRGGRAR